MQHLSRFIFLPLVLAVLDSSCTTADSGGDTQVGAVAIAPPAPKSAVQRAIGQCVASVGIGIGAGFLLGALSGNRSGAPVVVGAVAGGAICAVLLKVASDQDQAQISQAERKAVASTEGQHVQTFVTSSGESATITTTVAAAPVPPSKPVSVASASSKFTDCRYSSQSLEVEGQTASLDKQLWCRLDTGDWRPVAS